MADLPTPESFEQILGNMLEAYASKLGINDFNTGSAITGFFEVVALAVARSSGDIFQILKDFSVDRATGDALQRLATENGITPLTAQVATGSVTVTDTSFTKIATQIYAGSAPPNIGSTVINVSNASSFPATGSIYIGRGTPNIEGPLPYTSRTQTGNFWTITLSSPTAKFHNTSESVILAQGGNRTIPANAIVISPSVGSTSNIQYSVTAQAIILDGETQVSGVPIVALVPGSAGNVPTGAIKSFANPPFTGATVTNPLPLTTGRDTETDDQLRVRIKNALASKGLGTATAVKAALRGASAVDPATGQQSSIVADSLQVNTDGSATVFIDNGSIYEATTAGVGIEHIVDSAIGGEQFFQLQTGGSQAPVAKAFLQSTLPAPFALTGGDTLAVVVGGVTYQHTFSNSDFLSQNGATAFEVTASINADTSLGFEATTAGGGTFVVIRAKAETHDDIQVTIPTVTSGRNAAIQMGFPTNLIETLRLYRNNIPLTKDGSTASVFTQAQALWSPTIANGETLILSVDGTAAITYTILNADFIQTGLYTTVSANNSLASWVEVFNNKLTGITASIVGQQIELTSNLGDSNRAQVVIDPSSTLVTKGMFVASLGLSSQGAASDFTLDRNTAQFELVKPLLKGDVLSAGTLETEGMITSGSISSGSITFSSDAHIWFLIDSSGVIIPTGVTSNSTLTVSTPSSNVVRYTSNVTSAFSNVNLGDYIIIWSNELPSSDRIEGRVNAFTSTTLDILITPSEWSAITPGTFTFLSGFVVCRTNNVPQKFKVAAGTYSLDQIAAALQLQTNDLVFSVSQEQFLLVNTTDLSTAGSVMIVTADTQGQLMNFPAGVIKNSQTSLIAFEDSSDYQADFPLFIHSTFGGSASADPIDSYISSLTSSISLSGRDPNELIAFLQPYGTAKDAQPYGENVQETSLSGTTIGVAQEPDLRRVRTVDRFYIANPLDFGHADTAVVVLDNDPSNESFTIPFYRRAIANSTTTNNANFFNAYDVDSGTNASFTAQFPGFNFSNFKALMQAKHVLLGQAAGNLTGILYRAVQWGRSGEKVTVGYTYPSAANQPIGSSVTVGTTVAIYISLASGNPVNSSITSSTQWNITITPNTPVAGVDQVTYTWNTVGSNPNLSLSGGEIVNISTQSGFDPRNDGIFRVSTQVGFTPTSTSFSVQRPTGAAFAQTNAPTNVNNAILFYQNGGTTAAQIQAYVAANLSSYIIAYLVNDAGTSGSGVISLSTYEFTNFTSQNVRLLDGIDWISTSNISGSPQFNLKSPLSYISDTGYSFNSNAYGASIVGGEEVRLIPTTMDQVRRLINILAVTGFSTLGTINLADRGLKLELSTDVLGSSGAIQVIGGTGNEYQAPIINSAQRLDNTYMTASVNSVAGQGIHSDQWFRLQASQAQNKTTSFFSNSSITVVGNSPTTNESTITMLGRNLTQRYFGKPRHHVRSRGNTFKVEKQGKLVCISWNGIGTSPQFIKNPLNFNDTGGGTYSATVVMNTSDIQFTILTGNANFTELSIGDLLTVSGLPNNNGTFLVTGVSDDGTIVQVTNPNGVNQSSTAFVAGNFSASSGVSEGDTVTFQSPFNILNQGTFRVIREFSDSIWIENPNVVEEEVTLPYNSISLGFDSSTSFNVNATGHILRLTWNGVGTQPTLGNAQMGDVVTFGTDFSSGNQGSFMVLDSGTSPSGGFLECINPSAVNQSPVFVTNVLQCHRPQMQFWEYDATIVGDLFGVAGSFIGASNAGTYPVLQVLSRDSLIVKGTLSNVTNVSMNGNETAIFVEEGIPYYGYKHVFLISAQPGTTTLSELLFDTNAQYPKINQAAGVQMISLGKLNFSTSLTTGLDSYRFNTGLIAEANRIVYGDPRDPITYPGVGAAGADIFIREPLAFRIQVSVDVRLQTGAPFNSVAQQVRSSIAALVNSNPVGQSIDISSIVSAARSVPGVISVAINSPQYNATHDLITLVPAQKAIIINQNTDISVEMIGS